MIPGKIHSASIVWPFLLRDVLNRGAPAAPRGMETLEVPQQTAVLDMRKPVIVVPERKLSTKFLGGEAHWILSGDNRVSTIAPYNPNISKFSDDGVHFFGAYGPRIIEQLDYVVNKLKEDRDTRQAFLTIWRPNPPKTKDVPCTVACGFMRRGNKLDCYVFMRSNDLWLGFPYDVFNFSMLAHLVCCRLNEGKTEDFVEPGVLYHTAASRHIYSEHYDAAREIGDKYDVLSTPMHVMQTITTKETPEELFTNESVLMRTLESIKEEGKNSLAIWWK